MQQIKTFADIINFIDEKRKYMLKNNNLFKTLENDNIPYKKRMSFIPYMLFFSCGCPDVMTLVMRTEKPESELTLVEKKINAFVDEDNFHYNFYLKDIETLGYTFDKFGSTSAVIRHVFAEEAITVRKLIYSLSHYCRQHFDPLVRLTVTEILEAGLFDLFTIIYTKIIKKDDSPFANLHYYGDTHVNLEQNHTVTTWFSGNKDTAMDVSSIKITEHLAPTLKYVVEDMMDKFYQMYLAFDKIILSDSNITPAKYKVNGHPPIDKVTSEVYANDLQSKLSLLENKTQLMKHHQVFNYVSTIDELRTFMEWHVFAVWDFMSLIKRLQQDLTSTSVPWLPPRNRKVARLINEIVLGEETDSTPDGKHASHFEIYIAAMEEVGASTSAINKLIHSVSNEFAIANALEHADIPEPVKVFVKSTLNTASTGSTLEVLGSFFYGREDVIPQMFQYLLDHWTVNPKSAPMFVYYLQRHIELDSDSHSPAIKKVIAEITEDKAEDMQKVLDAAIVAVDNRIKLWDALADTLVKSASNRESA